MSLKIDQEKKLTLDELSIRPDLFAIQRTDVSENGISITFSDELIEKNGDLRSDKVCILKLDDYHAYNTAFTPNPPKVIDNLVVLQCCNGSIKLVLIELRKSNGKNRTRRLRACEIKEKFQTAIHDFIEVRHSDIFSREKITDVKAYLVSDACSQFEANNNDEKFKRKIKSSALDAYGSMKPFVLYNIPIFINPIVPPNPVIAAC